MELKPGRQPNTTRVIFETPQELYNSSRFCGLFARSLVYFGLADDPIGAKPLPGAIVDKDGLILPSEIERPLSNKRMANAASRLFKQSVEYYPMIDTEDLAMACTIAEYLRDLEQAQPGPSGEPSLETDPPSFVCRG